MLFSTNPKLKIMATIKRVDKAFMIFVPPYHLSRPETDFKLKDYATRTTVAPRGSIW